MGQENEPELQEVLATARKAFEQSLVSAMRTTSTQGSCLYGAVLVCEFVSRWTKLSACVRGGSPSPEGNAGFFDGRRWHGHYWAELRAGEGPVAVADITADQFGGPSVLLLPWEHAGGYLAGPQDIVDEVVAQLRRERELPTT